MSMSPLSLSPEDDKLQKSKSIDGCLYLFFPKKKMYVKKQSFLCLYAPRSCIQYYVIIFVSDLWQVSGFLQVSFTNKTNHHNITEIVLKVALSTINHKPDNLTYMIIAVDFIVKLQ
jgi:hypothetical protein